MKKILVILAGVVVVLLALPTVLPSKFSMSKSIEINVPVADVFNSLIDLNQYNKWNPFPEGDPTNTTKITGAGVGSYLEWKGEKTGEGKMTISQIEPNQKVSIKMEFFKPMTGGGMVYWVTKPSSENKTEMTWVFEDDLTYFNRYWGLFMEAMMGKHFEKGLVNFKSLLESPK